MVVIEVQITGTKVTIIGDKIIAFALNHLVDTFTATTDSDPEWEYKLDVFMTQNNKVNTILLNREGNVLSVDLTRDMLPVGGMYKAQFRMTDGNKIGHTEKFNFWVESSLDPSDKIEPIPTEYFQLENRMKSILSDCKTIYNKIAEGSVGAVAIHEDNPSAHKNISIDCGSI